MDPRQTFLIFLFYTAFLDHHVISNLPPNITYLYLFADYVPCIKLIINIK